MAIEISSGVISSGIILKTDRMNITSGGVANSTTVNSGGSMYITSGGVANSTTVNSRGRMYISSGGVANSTIVNSSGYMAISSGGSANNITISHGHGGDSVVVYSGGYASNVSVFNGGDFVLSGGSALNIILTSATSSTSDRSDLYIHAGYAEDITVHEYSWICVTRGTVKNAQIKSGGEICISSGGTANSTTVNSGGSMFIYGGGSATALTLSAGGMLGRFSFAEDKYWENITDGSAFIADNVYIIDSQMYISSGGVANSTTVYSGGYMRISSGGVANSTTVTSWGTMYIPSGGVANSTTVNSSGYMYIRGGVANSTTLNEYGSMHINNGGVANSTVLSGYSAIMRIYNGGVANNTTVNNRYGGMGIYSGGVANSTTVNSSGYMPIVSGGVANSTTVNSRGFMLIYSGGVANSTTVNEYGSMYIYSGGSATALTLSAGGRLGGFSFAEDKYWENITDGSAFIADNVYIVGVSMHISSGGVANSTTVNSRGFMHISSGGVANSTTVNSWGWMYISNGGVANSTTVNYGGDMYISSGGVHRSNLTIADGAIVSAYEGGVIDFTVADRSVDDGYLINNLSLISGTPTYTITVSADQAFGTYKLAQGAENFTGTISMGDGTTDYGNITVNGDRLVCNNIIYELNEYNGNLTLSVMQEGFTDIAEKLIFINAQYNAKTTGKKQNGVELTYGENAFISIADALKKYPDLRRKTLITVENKVEGGIYYNAGVVAGTAVLPVIKATDNSYSYKANSTPRAVLTISRDTGSTEFIRFATVNLYGAKVNSITGGKLISNISKSSVDKKGTVTNTEKSTLTGNVAGKFTAINGSAGVVENYATVTLTGAEVATLSGGNTKETSNSKLVDSSSKDQKVISTVNNNIAAGSVTLKAEAKVDNIEQYKTVTLTDSVAGNITNFTSKDSKSDTATYDEAKNTVKRKVALTHTESTAGTFKATGSTVGDVTGFATVTLKNVTEAGDFRRVDSNGNKYSTVKETWAIKTDKKGVVTGSYTKTETFTRAGKFTATGSTVGDIENFSNVTLDGSKAEDISNFVEAKIVTKGTATWDNAEAYGRPEDYAIDLQGWNMEEPIVTKPLNGSVTLKNGASASSITNFKSVTMTASKVDGAINNVNKVTVNNGDSTIGSYTGTDGNDTVTIAKGAVLTANKIDLGEGAKDKLAINGTLILTGSEADLPFVNASKITGKGEIAVIDSLFEDVSVDFANLLNVGATADNFRGTAYENADDTAKKAVKWDGKSDYNGWLGDWSGAKDGSDEVDFIKFKATENAQLTINGEVDWLLLDKKGNVIESKMITAAGDYIIQLENKKEGSTSYTIELA